MFEGVVSKIRLFSVGPAACPPKPWAKAGSAPTGVTAPKCISYGRLILHPRTQGFDPCRGTVALPAVELRLILQLLAPCPRHHGKSIGAFVQGGHVSPELFELRDGVYVLLTMPPSFLDFLEGDVGWQSGSEFSNSCGGACLIGQVCSREFENREQSVDIDPAGI